MRRSSRLRLVRPDRGFAGLVDSRDSSVLTDVLETPPGSKRRVLVVDGDPWVATSSDALKLLDLRAGDPIDIRAVERSLAVAESEAAAARALRILDARDRSEGEMRARLLGDGYSEDLCDRVVERLAASGLVDDRRLAQAIVASLAQRKLYGRSRITSELRRRRIPEDIADIALEESAPVETEDERALIAARRLVRRTPDTERLIQRLARMGYTWQAARQAARDAIAGTTGDPA